MNLPVKTTGDLYPPRCGEEFWKWLLALSAGDPDEKGNYVLRRELRPSDRKALQDRQLVLQPWMQPASEEMLIAIVNRMRLGFGMPGETMPEAAAIARGHAKMLAGLPAWCVDRACARFGRGEVRSDELGGDAVSLAHGPSSAQLRRIAQAIWLPFARESNRIHKTLHGTAPTLTESGEERRAAGARMLQDVEEMKARQKEIAEAERGRLLRSAVDAERRRVESVLAEYDGMGLERPTIEEGKALVSPSLCLAMGWRIEEVGGRKVLTRPAFMSAQPETVIESTRGVLAPDDYWRRPSEGMPR